ncbi:MAG: hypothetical protein Q4D38_12700 [Planctomycetia bacterium]|nr:hypothetical protein [Planctomycetia bacterium]
MKKTLILLVLLMVPCLLFAEEVSSEGRAAGDRLVKTINGVEYAFRWCPAGSFMMGIRLEKEMTMRTRNNRA